MFKDNSDNKTYGVVFGAWDLFHAGHVAFLRECKSNCDILVVGLHVDPSVERSWKNKPVQSVYERWEQLNACKFIDKVIPYETEQDLLNMLTTYNFDVRFLGSDYSGKTDYTGFEVVPEIFVERHHSYSTTELRDRIKNAK